MKKAELACSIPMASLLAGVPEDAEIGSVAVFVGVKGGGVFMGSHMDANPEQVATMLGAFGEARRTVIEGVIKEYGTEMLVTMLFYLASNQPDTKDLGDDELLKKYFVPDRGENG